MQLLLTNDDGIDAPGLQALEEAARSLGEIVLAAPHVGLSGCAHQATTSVPISIESRAPGRYAIGGTPADCVRLALHELAPSLDWVLSGVNAGGNLGTDIYHSGTVAAVREAALHGKPGIAVSHYLRRDLPCDWHQAARRLHPLLQDLLARPWEPGSFWNVNFPHLPPDAPDPEVVFCPLDTMPLPLSFQLHENGFRYNGDYHNRSRLPGSDVDVCFGGKIAVTLMRVC